MPPNRGSVGKLTLARISPGTACREPVPWGRSTLGACSRVPLWLQRPIFCPPLSGYGIHPHCRDPPVLEGPGLSPVFLDHMRGGLLELGRDAICPHVGRFDDVIVDAEDLVHVSRRSLGASVNVSTQSSTYLGNLASWTWCGLSGGRAWRVTPTRWCQATDSVDLLNYFWEACTFGAGAAGILVLIRSVVSDD